MFHAKNGYNISIVSIKVLQFQNTLILPDHYKIRCIIHETKKEKKILG